MKTFVELLILLILVSAGLLIYGLHVGGPDNPINQAIRDHVLKSSFTRTIMALNEPGDFRYQYLRTQNGVVTIEVDIAPGITPGKDLETWLKGMIKDTTGKTVSITQSHDGNIPAKSEFSYTELITYAKKSRDPLISSQPSYLHILYLPRSSNDPTNAGMVLSAADIFIFKDVINELSDRENIRARIEQSTIMHEWGHLLGLEHNDQTNCLMSETVEVYPERKYQAAAIPTAYCPNDYAILARFKKEANAK